MFEKSPEERRADWLVVGFLIVGFVLRILYHLQYSSSIFWEDLTIDEQLHYAWALYISKGNLIGDSAFFRAPLYPYFLALLFKLFAANLHAVFVIQHLIGIVTGWLIYRVGRDMFSYTTGVLALMLYVLAPTFIYFEETLLLDFLILPLNLTAFLFLHKAVTNRSNYAWVFCGIFLGLSTLTRPNILIFMPFLAVWILIYVSKQIGLKKALIRIIILAATVSIVIMPITLRNYIVSNKFALIATQGGINFYLGNNRDATGLSAYMPTLGFAWDYEDCVQIAEKAEGKKRKSFKYTFSLAPLCLEFEHYPFIFFTSSLV